jgi:predicted RNase H-like nuclease (RuvC/YqgF family)
MSLSASARSPGSPTQSEVDQYRLKAGAEVEALRHDIDSMATENAALRAKADSLASELESLRAAQARDAQIHQAAIDDLAQENADLEGTLQEFQNVLSQIRPLFDRLLPYETDAYDVKLLCELFKQEPPTFRIPFIGGSEFQESTPAISDAVSKVPFFKGCTTDAQFFARLRALLAELREREQSGDGEPHDLAGWKEKLRRLELQTDEANARNAQILTQLRKEKEDLEKLIARYQNQGRTSYSGSSSPVKSGSPVKTGSPGSGSRRSPGSPSFGSKQ